MKTEIPGESVKASDEVIRQIIVVRLAHSIGVARAALAEFEGLDAAIRRERGLRFEIGDWPGYVPAPCDICGRCEHAALFCIRIAGYTAGHNFICWKCSTTFAPELLPELEHRIDEAYKKEYGPDYKERCEAETVVVDDIVF
jgi:hypothetical protein